jgi:thymidylate kinase
MKELIIIETTQLQQVKKLLEESHIDYKVYQEPNQKQSLFANYGEAIKDKQRELEAQELENAEEEDIISEEW